MTPRKKDDTTIINIEKVERRLLDETQVAHKAGGHNTGLVINKQIDGGCLSVAVGCYSIAAK